MDLRLSPDDIIFRDEIRAFVETSLPADIRRRGQHDYHSHKDDVTRWMRILYSNGWSAVHWPVEFGGTNWSPLRKYIFQDELRRARAPVLDRCALDLLGPVLFKYGSRAQQERFLPRILRGEEWWCQGFSEPNSGSDLASIKTRAELSGDTFRVNGHKIWTTEAHYADWMFALVKTESDKKPQASISFLLLDMKSPGVTVRPIWSIEEGLTLNEVFLEDVSVPAENLVGTAGEGWRYAKDLLTHERTSSAVISHTKRDIEQIRRIASRQPQESACVIDDPLFARKLSRLECETIALEWAVLRSLSADQDDSSSDAVASVLKLKGAELSERAALLAAEALGDYGIAVMNDPEGHSTRYPSSLAPPITDDEEIGVSARALFRRATTIYGGTSEIQKTLIARSILEL
ncbi:acyl-CoA dehydrogenase family protein [Haliea sp.]